MTQLEERTGGPEEALERLSLPVLVVALRPAPVVRFVNPAFADAIGSSVSLAGLPVDVLPFDLTDPLARVAATGASVHHRVPAPQGAGTWLLVLDPVRDDGGVTEVVVTAVDIGAVASPAGPAVRDDIAVLSDDALGVDELLAEALVRAVQAGAARRAVLYVEADGALERVAWHEAAAPTSTDAAAPPSRLEAAPLPVASRGDRPRSLAWSAEAHPPPLPWLGAPGWERALLLAVPRRAREDALLVVADPIAGTFAAPEVDRLLLLTALLATGWRNTELRRDRAELAALLRGALDTSAGLVEEKAPAGVRGRLLRGLVEEMGLDAAALWVLDSHGDGLELVGDWGLPDAVRDRVRHLPAASTASRLAKLPVDDEDHPPMSSSSSWPGHVVRLVEVPRPAQGVLGVYSRAPLPPLVDGILATLAHALASATHLTDLHRRASSVVESLQRELRPQEPDLPGDVEVGWVYESATVGVEVGGDFYDVFRTADGRLAVVCGDVSGKGIEAASLTAMAVHALRAYGRDGAAADVVVADLNGMACERTGDERFMTLAYALLDPITGEVDLTLAGHPPPVRVTADGAEVVCVEADLPVGVLDGVPYTRSTFTLAPGDGLVFYTDGVTEARRGGAGSADLLGVDGLVEILAAIADRDAAGLADGVWDAVQSFTAGGTGDDVAIVALRRARSA